MFWNRIALFSIFAFLAFNLLVFNHSITLWDEDEAAYAGFAQQMLNSGDWVNPEYQWSTIHRKTPFHFWTVAVSFSMFGVNEFALRLPGALAIWLSCFLLWRWGRYVFSDDQAAWASMILSGSILVNLYGKVAFTDGTLLLFQTTAVLGLLNYLHQPHWRWNLLLWASVTLGLLTKGPPILILIGGLWFWLLLFHPQRRHLVGTHPWFWLPVSLLPLAGWMYLSWQRDGGALLTFLYEWYIVKRVGGSVLGQTAPPGYHLLLLFVSFFVWMPFLWMAIGNKVRHWKQWSPQQIALAGWMVFGWLFFEAMTSKLPSYALGAYPAWALAIGSVLPNSIPIFPRAFKIAIVLQTVIWSAIIAGFISLAVLLGGENAAWTAGASALVLLGGGITLLRYVWQHHYFAGMYTAFFNMTLLAMVFAFEAWVVEPSPIKSIQRLTDKAAEWIHTAATHDTIPLYYTNLHIKQKKISLPVYLSRSVKLYEELPFDVAMYHLTQPPPVVVIVGDGDKNFVEGLKNPPIPIPDAQIDTVAWRSTDDQLRAHPFIILRNFK